MTNTSVRFDSGVSLGYKNVSLLFILGVLGW